MASSDKFCLRWNDFETNISEAFRELREEKDFFDVTLACDDSQIQAHKVILSACSPFFRNVLRRNPHQHPLLYLKGVKYKELLCVLNFMYQGEVNVAQEELNSFLSVAEDLRVKGLTQNNSSIESKPKTDPSKVTRPPPCDPPPREPVPPSKRPRPNPPLPPVNTYQQEEDDDIQEVVPVKSEPRDTTTTMSNIDSSVFSLPQPASYHPSPASHHPSPASQHPSPAPQHDTGGQDGALALDDSYADESYDYGQYEEGGYDDGSGMIDPNTGMPIQGVGGAEGNKGEIEGKMSREITDGGAVWRCLVCHYCTKFKPVLFQHVESKHTVSDGYNCQYCEKFCPSRNALRCHVSRNHNSVKRM